MSQPTGATGAGARVLVVEDEADLLFLLRQNLEKTGFVVSACRTAKEARAAATAARPDVLLLDVGLPDGTGFDLLAGWRKQELWAPAVFLTARADEADRLMGFAVGGDDYVVKPFSMAELMARLAAIARRARQATGGASSYVGPGFKVEYDRFRLVRKTGKTEEEHALTYLEAEMLRYLIERPNQPVSRTELLDRVWGADRFPTNRTVDTHVLNVRKKLEPDPQAPRHLLTVHGVGYKFVP